LSPVLRLDIFIEILLGIWVNKGKKKGQAEGPELLRAPALE
jgi:hypothetical protein